MLVPPPEDSRRSAPERKPCPGLGDTGGVEAGESTFLVILIPGGCAAPNGSACSSWGLFGPVGEDAGSTLGPPAAEPDENFELILDIHELRRLGGGCF